MDETTRQIATDKYRVKNRRRREMPRTSEARLARIQRRAVGGAFGNANRETFNALAIGTTASNR